VPCLRTLLSASIILVALILAAPAAAAPSARYSYAPADPYTGDTVRFDGSSSICDDAPCSYTWQDDGPDGPGGATWPLGTGQELDFTFKVVGTKWVRLIVRNARGEASSMPRTITMQQGPRPGPEPAPDPEPEPQPQPTPTPTPTPAPSDCTRSATPSTFASQVSAATAGDVICLASGNYDTWGGTSKAITVREAEGHTATMGFNFTTGDQGFTVDGVTTPGGSITNGARDITIRNSTFTSHLRFDGLANSNILLDHNTHNNIDSPSGAPNARIGLYWGSSTHSGVTIRNSLMRGGDSDGVHTGVAVNIIGNEFADICQDGPNHTDNIQYEGATGGVVRGNYVHATCTTQGITSYDGNTNGVLIEDNVVDIRRQWGIEWYADTGSIIRHNTLKYYPAGCYAGQSCGWIDINRKSTDPAGRDTVVVDNIATAITVSNGSTVAQRHHNLVRQGAATGDILGTPVFAGGATPTSYAGFALAPGSPGKNAASDTTDTGITP
jgi:hypothetical protein